MTKAIVGLILSSAITLAGCATVPVAPTELQTPFNESDFAWSKAKGNNTISGNAVMRTVGGDAKTCAASQVLLMPSGAFTKERMMRVYGSTDVGYLDAYQPPVSFTNDPPAYHGLARTTTCDSSGNFTFMDLPDGEYHVLAQVVWGVPMQYYTSRQGGTIMQRVSVSGGETKRVVLSR